MKLVNVTNSHSGLVLQQLENTDAFLVKVYTAGDTLVIYTEAPLHNEILIVNNNRSIRPQEIDEIKQRLLKKIAPDFYEEQSIAIIENDNMVEISIPKKQML